jgi:3-isopropylmalate/(R)-2-methylmalate dehydratase large subunit
MGKTISEKILAKDGGKTEVSPGDYVSVSSSRPVTALMAMGRGGGQFLAIGAKKLFDPKRVVVIDDHPGVTATAGVEEGRAETIRWAKKYGIPRSNIFMMGRNGIGHIVAAERCWALPGTVYLSITNGHTTTLGGMGSFAITLSYESGAYLATGYTWIRVPETVKFNITGELGEGVMAIDVFEYVLGQIGPAGAPYQVMEWTGPVIDQMSMDGRFSLCCNALFVGAKTGIVNPDQKTIDYVSARTEEPFEPIVSDQDAEFAKTYNYDVSDLEPQIVPPPKRYVVKPVKEYTGVKINRAYIGSCTNARIEDMRIAAKILKGAKIHPDVRLNITHGSVNILKQSVQEGLYEIFIDAEAELPSPCCGMCYGQNTPLAAGDVCISAGTCNYDGRMGSMNTKIYIANPAAVAASAIEGKITDPREYL